MQTRHFNRATLVAAALAVSLPFGAMAFQGKYGNGPKDGTCQAGGGHFMKSAYGMHGGGLRGLQRLDLSEAQQDKIFDLMHERAPAARQQMKALQKNERELQALRQSNDFSEARAKALIDDIARQRADMELARLQGERQVLDILTPEQRQQLQAMRAGKPGKMGRMGERGPRS